MSKLGLSVFMCITGSLLSVGIYDIKAILHHSPTFTRTVAE
jgi:hypothetical protein